MPSYYKDGVSHAWEERGDRTPLVLLHPFPLNSSFWAGQREALAPCARVITPDFRGFGQSGQDGRISTMELLADDLADLLNHLHLDRVILGGLSMGGYVSMAFLRNHAARVRALILADTRPQADMPEGRQTREELANLVISRGAPAVADQMLPRLLGRTAMQTRPDLVAAVRRMIEGAPPAAIAAASRGMALRQDCSDLLSSADCPLLVIAGEEDILTTVQSTENWALPLRNASLRTISAAGHLASLEQPHQFNEAVRSFIADFL